MKIIGRLMRAPASPCLLRVPPMARWPSQQPLHLLPVECSCALAVVRIASARTLSPSGAAQLRRVPSLGWLLQAQGQHLSRFQRQHLFHQLACSEP